MDPNRELPSGTITFLFTDIEGSTRLSQRVGEARFAELLETHRRLLRQAIAEESGNEFGTEGDAVFAAFRGASKGVAAAAAAQRALERHEWPDDGRVRVRMGLHTGEATLDGDGNYVGLALHRAARICSAAHGGQVLLSEATRSLLGESPPGDLRLIDLGGHVLKDFDDPAPLYQLIVPGLAEQFPPLRTLDSTRNNLPRQLTSFVGREGPVAEAAALLRRTSLLTLTGPGGTGKTRLSLKLAEDQVSDFPDGVFFVALAPISDPEFVPSAIGRALGLPESPGRTPLDVAIEFLRSRRILLVLDNFEQVVPAAPIVADLLRAAPDLKIIVTSRAVLHVSGEQEYQVPPLQMPDPLHLPPIESLSQFEAVALFVERARAARPDFALTEENGRAVAEICARLDGLPLAIELAAARVRLLPPRAIESRLASRLDLLSGSSRDLTDRQRTLRGAIAWSHDLLDEDARALFARLSVFVGGWTIESAEAVSDFGRRFDVLDGLAGLVDQSLVRQEEREGEPRFGMLETIREFALEQLEGSHEAAALRERHARHFLSVAERAAPLLEGSDRARWLDLLETEHDNLRAAIGWAMEQGEADLAFRMLDSLWRFWQTRDHLLEGSARAAAILAMPGEVAPELRARAHGAAGGLAWWSAELERMRDHYAAALAIAREIGEPHLLAEALYNMSFGYSVGAAERKEALEFAGEALSIYERLGDDRGRARALWAIGNVRYFGSEFAESEDPFRQALALSTAVGDTFMRAWSLHMLGSAEIRTGQLEASGRHLREALDLLRWAGETTGIAIALDDFGDLAAALGDFPRSLRLSGAARSLEEATAARLAGTTTVLVHKGVPTGSLSVEEQERCRAEGRAMTLDEAIELAVGTCELLPKPTAAV